MSIWNRLGTIINSHFNDFERETSGRFNSRSGGDPDLDAAYEELND
jgi:hypothetical protein